MKILAVSAFAIAVSLSAMSASQAMPTSSGSQALSSNITLVAQGCGPGFHRGPRAACRPLYNCPPGWHPGPFGKCCFRN